MEKYSRGKEYKTIAYCISRFHRNEQRDHIYHMCKYARQYKCKVFIFSTLTDLYYDDINDYGEKQIYSLMEPGAFDAVVIMSETFKKVRIDREIADRAIKAGVPVISVNRQLEGCINIDFTYAETFEKIVRHIIEEHGCRKVNYIGGDTESKFSGERFDAYKKVLKENNIPFEEKRTGYGNFRDVEALQVLEEFLKEDELPEAIICANDAMAMAVCGKLKSLGIRVPEDIKISGFDGEEYEKYNNPRLTTAAYDWEKVATTIFETVCSLAEGKAVDELIWIPYKYQIGHSCGCGCNDVQSAVDTLFKWQMNHGEGSEFYQDIMNMVSKTNNCEEFSEILCLMDEYSKRIKYKRYWCCFKEEIWNKIDRKQPSEVEFERIKYKEKKGPAALNRIVVTHYTAEDAEDNVRIIPKAELLCELSDVMETEEKIMFIPIQLQGLFMGYIAVTFDMDIVNFDLLNIFALNIRNVIESYWSRVAQDQLMSRDELTGMYNARGFQRKIKRIFADGAVVPNFTLLTMDIDNLKKINDTYGHEEGDQALKELSRIIELTLQKGEICARKEGDEFAVVSMSSAGRTRAQEIQDLIERRLADYNLMSGKPYDLQVSIGSYSGTNVDALDYEVFASQADKEMYNSKQHHKSVPDSLWP